PVYYLGSGSSGQRLYREYHQLPVGGTSTAQRIEAAVGAMLGMPASDPDYRSPWPAGAQVGGGQVAGGTATVDLSGAAGGDTDPDTARTALEQLVWTVTAASVPPSPASSGSPSASQMSPASPASSVPGAGTGGATHGPLGLSGVVLRLDGQPATQLWGVPVPD